MARRILKAKLENLPPSKLAAHIFDLVESLIKKQQAGQTARTNYISATELRWLLRTARKQAIDKLQEAEKGFYYERLTKKEEDD